MTTIAPRLAPEDTLATYNKVSVMKEAISHLRVKDKRAIFLLMRTAADQLTVDTFFPLQGFTAGEFAVGQVLAENNRKSASTVPLKVVETKEEDEEEDNNDDDEEVVPPKPKKARTKSNTRSPKNKVLKRRRPTEPVK